MPVIYVVRKHGRDEQIIVAPVQTEEEARVACDDWVKDLELDADYKLFEVIVDHTGMEIRRQEVEK